MPSLLAQQANHWMRFVPSWQASRTRVIVPAPNVARLSEVPADALMWHGFPTAVNTGRSVVYQFDFFSFSSRHSRGVAAIICLWFMAIFGWGICTHGREK